VLPPWGGMCPRPLPTDVVCGPDLNPVSAVPGELGEHAEPLNLDLVDPNEKVSVPDCHQRKPIARRHLNARAPGKHQVYCLLAGQSRDGVREQVAVAVDREPGDLFTCIASFWSGASLPDYIGTSTLSLPYIGSLQDMPLGCGGSA